MSALKVYLQVMSPSGMFCTAEGPVEVGGKWKPQALEHQTLHVQSLEWPPEVLAAKKAWDDAEKALIRAERSEAVTEDQLRCCADLVAAQQTFAHLVAKYVR